MTGVLRSTGSGARGPERRCETRSSKRSVDVAKGWLLFACRFQGMKSSAMTLFFGERLRETILLLVELEPLTIPERNEAK